MDTLELVLDETLLTHNTECQVTSHLCSVTVTHGIFTRCGQTVHACTVAAALQIGRTQKRSTICGNCGKVAQDCWEIRRI